MKWAEAACFSAGELTIPNLSPSNNLRTSIKQRVISPPLHIPKAKP
jgi:hypothetical protein